MVLSECSWDEARAVFSNSFSRCSTQTLSLPAAHGRVLAADAYSLCDLPAFETSSMDGWVTNGEGPWEILGEVKTGQLSDLILGPSQSLRIATGGVIPRGGQSVLPWEEADERAGFLYGRSELGANIRPAGQESKAGELLISAGTYLNAPKIGLLAASGHDEIEVARKPRVAIFFLGDELVHAGVPAGGSVRDALGPQLPAILELYGAEVVIADFVTDDLDLLINKISVAINSPESAIDIVITTGGTADGPRDFIKPAITALGGQYLIDRVRVRPGYHVLLAEILSANLRKIAFLALPGNPQSALAALTSFGQPLIASLGGATIANLAQVHLREEIKTQAGFARLVPGTLADNNFTPTGYLGSHMLRGVAQAAGFALINPGFITRWLPIAQ